MSPHSICFPCCNLNTVRLYIHHLVWLILACYEWSLSAERSPEGLIGSAESVLRYAFAVFGIAASNFLLSVWISQVSKLRTKIKQDSIPLSYTPPRKFITHPGNHYFHMIEGDRRVLGEVAADY